MAVNSDHEHDAKPKELYDTTAININRRNALKTIAVAGAAAATGGATATTVAAEDDEDSDGLFDLDTGDITALGLGGVVGFTYRNRDEVRDSVASVFNIGSDEDARDNIDDEHIDTWRSIETQLEQYDEYYEERLLEGTLNNLDLIDRDAMNDGIASGLQARDAGDDRATAITEGRRTVEDYFATLQKQILEDLRAIIGKRNGIRDAITLQEEMDEEIIGFDPSDGRASYRAGDAVYTMERLEEEIEDDDGDPEEEIDNADIDIDEDSDGHLITTVELVDGEEYEVPLIASYTDDDGISYFSPYDYNSNVDGFNFVNEDGDGLEALSIEKWNNAWDAIEVDFDEVDELVEDAIDDLYEQGIDTDAYLDITRGIDVDLNDPETDISGLQTAFATTYYGGIEDLPNTIMDVHDDERDEDFEGSIFSPFREGYEVGETYESDGQEYLVNEQGQLIPLDGSYTIDDITRTETDEETGEETETDLEDVDVNNTDLTTTDADEIFERLTAIEEQNQQSQEWVTSGGGGGLFDGSGRIITLLLGGGLLAFIAREILSDGGGGNGGGGTTVVQPPQPPNEPN